ncbi:MAG: hypothetical protein CFH30_00914, partial [Alphaproteobacteria bacterium MarineAlpha8_Bin1]
FSLCFSQDIEYNDLIDRIDRIERNVSDLQKGKLGQIDKNLPAGYISRNESRLDKIETKNRLNYGILEEIQNKLQSLENKIDLINKDFQARIIKIEKEIKKIPLSENKNINLRKKEVEPSLNSSETLGKKNEIKQKPTFIQNEPLTEDQLKKKYENAIKLLWASKYEDAQKELLELKKSNPKDLMPNIQYWLGEVFYAQKDFGQAVIEFGEGLKKYPDSIKGPDNMLKLGLSFSNLKKVDEACNVLSALENKYEEAPKNVLEIAKTEKDKLKCPEE